MKLPENVKTLTRDAPFPPSPSPTSPTTQRLNISFEVNGVKGEKILPNYITVEDLHRQLPLANFYHFHAVFRKIWPNSKLELGLVPLWKILYSPLTDMRLATWHRISLNCMVNKDCTFRQTRMHSRRMRTVRCSSHLGGGVYPGCRLAGGVGWCTLPSPPPWTDRHLRKHNLSATTVADGNEG